MADVRSKVGVPVATDFTWLGVPMYCSPIIVDSTTGIAYTLVDGGTVEPVSSGGLESVYDDPAYWMGV